MQTIRFSTFWTHKWLILFTTAAAVGAGWLYLENAPAVYESEASVLVVRSEANRAVPMATERYFLATQAEIMRSPLIVSQALEKVREPSTLPMEELLENVRVAAVDDTDVLSVTVRDENSKLAHGLVDAIVDTFSDYVREIEQERTTDSVAALVRRERELSTEIDSAQSDYVTLRKESPLVGKSGDGIQIPMAQLKQLATELSVVANRRISLENTVKVADQVGIAHAGGTQSHGDGKVHSHADGTAAQHGGGVAGTLSGDVQTTHILDDLRQAQSEERLLARQFGENHPKVIAAGESVKLIRDELATHGKVVLERTKQELAAVKILESQFQAEYSKLLASTKEMDHYIVQEQALDAKIARLVETHQALTATLAEAQMEESELRNGVGSVDVRRLDAAARVTEQVWPRPSLILGLSGVLGFIAGSLLALLRETPSEQPVTARAAYVPAETGHRTTPVVQTNGVTHETASEDLPPLRVGGPK